MTKAKIYYISLSDEWRKEQKLEWILDQYKEKKPPDATIREKFNSYRFADCKETVIDLLRRVLRRPYVFRSLINTVTLKEFAIFPAMKLGALRDCFLIKGINVTRCGILETKP